MCQPRVSTRPTCRRPTGACRHRLVRLLPMIMLLLLASCGGSSDPSLPGGGDGGGIPGTPVTPAERKVSLEAVEAELLRLVAGGSSYDPEALLTFLDRQSAFAEVGYSPAAACAWAVYTDGRVLMIANDPATASGEPLAPAAAAVAPRAAKDEDSPLLTAGQWRSVETLTCVPHADYFHVTANWVDGDSMPRLTRIAAALGFDVVDLGIVDDDGYPRPRVADVEGLKTVSGDGVLLITAAGGYAEARGVPVSAIRTLTPAFVSEELNLDYEVDLTARRLVYFLAPPCLLPEAAGPATCLAITPEFARFYQWSFPTGSVVYLNTTGSTLAEWVSPLQAAGARVVLGWSGGAELRTMLGAAQDFFEMLFATNNLGSLTNLGSEPRLRSYGIDEIYSYLWEQGLLSGIESDGQSGSLELFQDYGSDGFVNQLLPSIEYLFVNEATGQMDLVGEFGTESGRVRIGTATTLPSEPALQLVADGHLASFEEYPVVSWDPHLIRVELPENRAPAGMVQVVVGQRFSNIAHLTRWVVPFQINRTVGGTLLRSVSMEVALRGFVSGYRISPAQALDEQWPFMTAINMSEGQVGWSASGSKSLVQGGGSTTVTWSGAGNFNRADGADELFSLTGLMRVPERRLECTLAMRVTDGLHVTTVNASPQGSSTLEHDREFAVATPTAEFPSFGALQLHFTDDWHLQAGSMMFNDQDESVFGGESCQTQVTWGAVTAQFPPEDDRGGR